MEILFVLPVVLLVLIGLSVALDFMYYCINGKRLFRPVLSRTLEVLVVLGFPLLYLGIFDFQQDNDCCNDSAIYPVLIIICLPVILVVTAILLLFGQQPDSSIRAFTETYKHGFSQWDYMCDNVQCGGHFLCSVAAQGHPNIVRPKRLGVRHGKFIICNRQLLIANAFEDIIMEQFPYLHRLIRRNYNRIGDLIHRYYYWFENKYVSDTIYYLMKPLEWCFWIYLYLTDRQPENRIARQYL